MNKVFSKNLKKLRMYKGLTQEQAAEVLGVSSQTVSRWECNTTYPDVMLLPEIAKLYCVTVDDLFKPQSFAYANYAQRLASIYETTRNPIDFIYADNEFKKRIKKGEYSTADLWTYGTLHHFMVQYSICQAIDLFDTVIDKGKEENEDVFWKTKVQKMLLYSQIGKSKESIKSYSKNIENGCGDIIDWRCIIQAYIFDNDMDNAYKYFTKAIKVFQNDAILFALGGDICNQLGNSQKALSYWNKAIKINSSCLEAKYSLINYYAQIGDKNKCKNISKEIVDELEKAGLDIEAEAEQKRLENLTANLQV